MHVVTCPDITASGTFTNNDVNRSLHVRPAAAIDVFAKQQKFLSFRLLHRSNRNRGTAFFHASTTCLQDLLRRNRRFLKTRQTVGRRNFVAAFIRATAKVEVEVVISGSAVSLLPILSFFFFLLNCQRDVIAHSHHPTCNRSQGPTSLQLLALEALQRRSLPGTRTRAHAVYHVPRATSVGTRREITSPVSMRAYLCSIKNKD